MLPSLDGAKSPQKPSRMFFVVQSERRTVIVLLFLFICSSQFKSMDYRGQKLSEYIYAILTILCGGIGWIVGFYKGSFMLTFYGWAIGLALSLVVSVAQSSYQYSLYNFELNLFQLCIPDWPMFNRNKVIWSDEVSTQANKGSKADAKGKIKKSKKAVDVK